jgi:KUP system potassium uptake protein
MSTNQGASTRAKGGAYALMLGALGVVFGDIGTSPLYAFEVVFANPLHPVAPTPENILGVLSLFVWSLVLIVTLKYVLFIMRFDNGGEGGIVALLTLLLSRCGKDSRLRLWFVPLGLLGAALFYGDGVITPAISVVSAVEGLETISPAFEKYVVPVSLVVLVLLFLCQSRGTESIARLFGPVMLIWFFVLAALGIHAMSSHLGVLAALNPWHALQFVATDPLLSFFLLGAVVLCLTGAEALYADMGHFGVSPIRRAWILVAFPALVLNYLGQGALVLQSPENLHNPFFRLAPEWGLNSLVVLATMATVIASQAVISGVFSMTQQLIQLRAVPRMTVRHTSDDHTGQIYIPATNWIMLVLVVTMVLTFQSSNAMSGAYGIAVTGTMVITDLFAMAVLLRVKRWRLPVALAVVIPFVVIDMLFFAANALKLMNGGWFPVLLSSIILLIILTWMRGVASIQSRESEQSQPLQTFVQQLQPATIFRNHSTVVCLSSDETVTPGALMLMSKRLSVVPEKVICLTVKVLEVPFVNATERCELTDLGQGIYSVVLHYGYRDRIRIAAELKAQFPDDDTIQDYGYLINRWSLAADKGDGWSVWRKRLFVYLFRNAPAQWRVFEMPEQRVVELGQRLIL